MQNSAIPASIARSIHASLLNLLSAIDHPEQPFEDDLQDSIITGLTGLIRSHVLRFTLSIEKLHHLEQYQYFLVKGTLHDIAMSTYIVEHNNLTQSYLVDFVQGLCDLAEIAQNRVECINTYGVVA